MLIVADNNIPFAAEAFGHLGEVRTVQGRGLAAEGVAGADVLLLRSTVKINAELLGKCSPKFVGTATIGTDHVDEEYLASRGIPFASAPGSNAESVAEYWTSAVLLVAARLGWNLRGVTCGVVGVGNVGSRVARRAEALGMRVLKCDPPLARQTGSDEYRPLEELLAESRIITLHAPLNREGEDATLHMADAGFFAKLPPDAVFLNTARGKVHDTPALLAALESGRLAAAVLDVWEGEPLVETEL
ncbi:MAG: 4-phosphoerythronate dehydrogenase, partial [Planctomycetota bacterium]